MAHSDRPQTPRRRRARVMLAVIGGVTVTIALAGAFGGLRTRAGGPAVVSPGSTVDQGAFKVQVLDARAGRFSLGSFDKNDDKLVVRMRVTNTGDRSNGVSSFIGGIVAEPKPGHYAEADETRSIGELPGGATSDTHPRLPLVVQAVWPLPATTTLRSVTVALRQWNYGQGFTDDSFYWSVTKSSPITAKVTVPVRMGATS
ncbi:hypothetical protein NE236_43115 [Actinoallomurus purpureus]|uniref:hypothetical protein n=1 Tax=Actinoallomurus purpureus TaxID=478114 RepID=UPI0020921171|nr:hypothetical protein [Actinoallomurus purpureus]MCO6011759.1 hypothetical protein [Actinoallomurus purpureus]